MTAAREGKGNVTAAKPKCFGPDSHDCIDYAYPKDCPFGEECTVLYAEWVETPEGQTSFDKWLHEKMPKIYPKPLPPSTSKPYYVVCPMMDEGTVRDKACDLSDDRCNDCPVTLPTPDESQQ